MSLKKPTKRFCEFLLVAVSLSSCAAVWFSFGGSIYLTEIAVLGVLSCLCIILDRDPASSFPGKSSWAIAGMLSALTFLGGFSIGPMLLPAPICLVAASALADQRRSRAAEPGIITALVAGVVQAAIVIIVMTGRR